jgi:hypothetical protein
MSFLSICMAQRYLLSLFTKEMFLWPLEFFLFFFAIKLVLGIGYEPQVRRGIIKRVSIYVVYLLVLKVRSIVMDGKYDSMYWIGYII